MTSKKTQRRKRQKAGLEPINPVGVRINKKHSKKTKERIKTSQILNRLNKFVLQELDDEDEKPLMSAVQVTAAMGLLKKVMPDLASVHQTQNPNEKTHEEWLNEFNSRST